MTLFDPDEGRRLADEAIRRVDTNADPEWRDLALAAVRHCAETMRSFTTDEVHAVLAAAKATTHEARAMGAVMRRAASEGWIVPTQDWTPTARPEAHRQPKRVWRSLIFDTRRLPG